MFWPDGSDPPPATVVITPFETLRMRSLQLVGDVEVAARINGDTFRLTQLGEGSRTVITAETGHPISRHSCDDPIGDFADTAVRGLGNVEVASRVHGDARGVA